MLNSKIQVIVKVGNKSNIMFNSNKVKAYRAITLMELEHTINAKDITILVIENIKDTEYDGIKAIIAKFKATNKDNMVYFYVADNDDTTCGVADELDYNIYLNLNDLHRAINSRFEVCAGNSLSVIREYKGSGVNQPISLDDTFDSSFGDAIETLNKANENYKDNETDVIYELPDIDNKDDLWSMGDDLLDSIEDELVTQEKQDINENELKETDRNQVEVRDILLDDFMVKYKAIEDSNKELEIQLEKSLERIESLNSLIGAIEDDRDNYKGILREIQGSEDILEDPIGLDEYNNLNKEIDRLKLEIAGLNEDINSSEMTSKEIAELNKTIVTLEDKIVNISNELVGAKKQAEDKENEFTNKNEIAEVRVYTESKGRIRLAKLLELAVEKLASNSINIAKNNLEIEEYIEIIDKYKLDSENNKLLIDKQIADILEKDTEIAELRVAGDSLDTTLASLNESQAEVTKLNIELARLIKVEEQYDLDIINLENELKQEIEKVSMDRLVIQSKLDLVTTQLAAKEHQYTTLVQSVGVNEGGASSLMENNATLNGINKSLRDQIIGLQSDLNKAQKENQFIGQSVIQLESTNKQLKSSLNVVTAGISAGIGANIPPCNYTGKGQIIPVFGSGSFGVTTTAMTLATKLGADTKVLYIDFDIVMPKADSWFKKNPIIKGVPEFDPQDRRFTGLGLFIDKGAQYLIQYGATLIQNVINTRGGKVDYLSGFYTRPETIKLISADYTTFFNYCGNNYDYVIVDMGQLGCSELNDMVIKVVSDIAYRSVVVTTNDMFEIRTFSMKLVDGGIDKNNTSWLVNMGESTKMDSKSKQFISPARYSIMPFNPDLYGKKMDFTKTRLTRDKFELFRKTIFNQ